MFKGVSLCTYSDRGKTRKKTVIISSVIFCVELLVELKLAQTDEKY